MMLAVCSLFRPAVSARRHHAIMCDPRSNPQSPLQVIGMVMGTDMKQHFSLLAQFNAAHSLPALNDAVAAASRPGSQAAHRAWPQASRYAFCVPLPLPKEGRPAYWGMGVWWGGGPPGRAHDDAASAAALLFIIINTWMTGMQTNNGPDITHLQVPHSVGHPSTCCWVRLGTTTPCARLTTCMYLL